MCNTVWADTSAQHTPARKGPVGIRDISLRQIHQHADSDDALDLAMRAADYVVLEVGHAPDAAYIEDFFTAVPPDLDTTCLLHFGIMQDRAMTGMVCIARGYEHATDWWIGLMLLDPAFRGRGIGHQVVAELARQAQRQHITALKLAVLSANPRALRFWQREGFVHHRDAPALPDSDGHDRVVLKRLL